MSEVVIQVDNIWKQYRLGQVGRKSLSHDINRWWHTVRGKEDPYLKIGQENDRTTKGESEYVWALQNINFSVNKGEVLGIIGRNGAGKSTLLKILSKVTSPTKGSIKINGRIASLLEVGTGFHPDLSGRDNIYLNGTILGMTKKEISSKFDEIVDFAGVERYIDTPVKRYSSGMYVRLAFAVAAHLEPEILIIDEVLAVGDAEFQKKCLGKMKDVSEKDGRTILFVSHNMDAISRLCNKAIIINNGKIGFNGNSDEGISYYLKGDSKTSLHRTWYDAPKKPGNEYVRLLEVKTEYDDNEDSNSFLINKAIHISMVYEVLKDNFTFTHGFNLYDNLGTHIFSSHDIEKAKANAPQSKGVYKATVTIPGNFLAEGLHIAGVAIMSYDPYIVHFHEKEAISFIVKDTIDGDTARGIYGGSMPGVVRPILKWQNVKLTQ